eukprot:scaffold5773_cov322-Prasinococcus_capsulatus_cf.AAC.2
MSRVLGCRAALYASSVQRCATRRASCSQATRDVAMRNRSGGERHAGESFLCARCTAWLLLAGVRGGQAALPAATLSSSSKRAGASCG